MENDYGRNAGTEGGTGSGGTVTSFAEFAAGLPADQQSLLTSIRDGSNEGTARNPRGKGRPASKNNVGAVGTDGRDHANDRGNGESGANDDRSNRGPIGKTHRTEPASGNGSGGAGESGRQSQRDRGRPSKGLKATGAPPKAATKAPGKNKLPWDDAAVLSSDEAAALRPNLVEGLTSFWEGADQLITYTNKEHAEAYIWQSIDEEETEFLADGIILIALRNKAAAAAVRGIANSSRLLRTGAILLPRFVQSVQFYSQHGGLVLGGF